MKLMLFYLSTTFIFLLNLTVFSQNTFPSSGNVGIGTTSPQQELHVFGSGKQVLFGDPSSSYPALQFFTGHSDGYNYIQSGGNASGNLRITKYNTSNQNLDNFQVYSNNTYFSGKVGIGTINPGRKLAVRGDVDISGDIFIALPRRISRGIYLFRDGAASATGVNSWGLEFKDGFDDNNYLLSLKTAGKLTLNLNKNGNVGVGTTTPDSKLSVNGNIHAKEVKVDLNGWSDFVFESDYELPTLEEVNAFIQKNGRLKDIPSAAEVEKNGVLLGEMNAKLLQKIEELTLYIINQNEKIKNQQLELQNQSSLNKAILNRLNKLESKI